MEGIVDTWVMKFSTFNPEQGWLKSPFADPITDLYPQYLKMLSVTDDPVALALGKILRVCVMHRVTDIYGPIPYSQMLSNDNLGENLSVPYDSQEQVYTQMLKELEEADKVLEENKDLSSEAFRKLEDLYYGNISKWRKFLHSMQLRIAMRMSYVNPTEAQRIAQNAVAVARPHVPVDMVEHRFVAEFLGDVREFNHLLAQTLHGHSAQLESIAHRRLASDKLLGKRHVKFRLG